MPGLSISRSPSRSRSPSPNRLEKPLLTTNIQAGADAQSAHRVAPSGVTSYGSLAEKPREVVLDIERNNNQHTTAPLPVDQSSCTRNRLCYSSFLLVGGVVLGVAGLVIMSDNSNSNTVRGIGAGMLAGGLVAAGTGYFTSPP